MKWETAIAKIGMCLMQCVEYGGGSVEVTYHRKWNKKLIYFDTVDTIEEYEWNGEMCKVVTTYHDQIDGATHVIDKVEFVFR